MLAKMIDKIVSLKETKIFEIRSGKESITQELAASEELEKTTQEQILGFQKELESCRLEESEASAHAGEWEVKVEKMSCRSFGLRPSEV